MAPTTAKLRGTVIVVVVVGGGGGAWWCVGGIKTHPRANALARAQR